MSDGPLLPQIILLLIFTLINALFSASEVALEDLSEGKLKKQIEEGDKQAKRLLRLVRKPYRLYSTIQICITLAGFLAAALAAEAFTDRLLMWIIVDLDFNLIPTAILKVLTGLVIVFLLACFTLVLGEMVPKRLAAINPEGAYHLTAGLVCIMSALLRPTAWLLSKSTNGILRLLGHDPKAGLEDVSEDEILMMVDLGEEQGSIEKEEKELIENIFEFNNNTAEDVMVHRTDMVLLWIDDAREEILNTIRTSGLSRFPVYNEDADDIVGILNTRDFLLNTQAAQPKSFRDLVRPAYFVPESVRTDVLFRDMQSKKVHMAIVVDEYGGTAGLVTMEDLLEEIVGNIYDEFDPQDELEIIPVSDGLWRIAGSADLEAIAEALDLDLPEDLEYDTLGGLVFGQLSVIPDDGSRFQVEAMGLSIQVEEFLDRRVEWALVSCLEPSHTDEDEDD